MASSHTATLSDLNAASPDDFVALVGPIVEHSAWIAERCVAQRPFASVEALRQALIGVIAALPAEQIDAIFRLHPELAGAEAASGAMTASSTSEQGRLGLTSLAPAQATRLAELNAAFRAKFGFPCIIALRLHENLASVLAAFEQRLAQDLAQARAANLAQIGEVVRGRLERLVMPQGWLSTHVLDTGGGRPAAGMSIDLLFRQGREWINLKSVRSNADGRTDEPLLHARAMKTGVYRLEFDAGGYFRAQGVADETPPFLDRVVLEFGVSDPDAHYHVPLLCTPWSYTTYRGS